MYVVGGSYGGDGDVVAAVNDDDVVVVPKGVSDRPKYT